MVIEGGASVRGAAGKYGIPEAVRDRVRAYVNPEVVKSGIPPLLNQEEELYLVEHLKVMAASGYGYSRAEVMDMASTYAVVLERIYNVDEKALKQNHSPPFIVTSLESAATTPAVVSGKSSTVIVIGCGNALGNQIPPYFVFRYYLEHHFGEVVQGRDSNKKILILYDGQKSHISLPPIDWAKDHNILLFILPAHTSRVLQPLDVGCVGPFEKISNEYHKFMRSNACTGIDRYSVSDLACKAFGKALSSDNLSSSFRKSGIYPFDPLAVGQSAFIPAKVLKRAAVRTQLTSDVPDLQEVTTSPSPSTLFNSREEAVGQVNKVTKRRRTISTVVSGKDITEDSTKETVVQHNILVTGTASSKPKRKATASSSGLQQPRPSSIKKTKAAHPVKRTTVSESSSDEITADKYCVCHRFVPLEKTEK
ncbi:uncharacterized protein [Haliotis asinina]|uniref:uncharacterized protein n=1 Tax=Haliotis asinina TaxID=109174 RepID=UPI003531D33E